MNLFLVIQNNYQELEIALMNSDTIIDIRKCSKIEATAHALILLENLLTSHSLTLAELPCIIVNQGPGPFTTLRVVIASVNGLSFASQIPLVGVDALTACLHEWHMPHTNTAVLLNAFNNDVYFATQFGDTKKTGYKNIDSLLEELKQKTSDPIHFFGNGCSLHSDKIIQLFGQQAIINPAQYCSIKTIGQLGWQSWQKTKTGTTQLMPLYIKNHEMQR